MKSVQLLLLSSILTSCALHGMEVDEWTGLRKYWYKDDLQVRVHPKRAYVYQHCKSRRNDQNCAVINAYLLLEAQERNYTQQRIKDVEMQISDNTKEIHATETAIAQEINFVKKSKLLNDLDNYKFYKKYYMERKKDREKEDLSIDTQLTMGNLSGSLHDKYTHQKLEDAFNAIVPSKKLSKQRYYLQRATGHAQKRNQCDNRGAYGT